LLSAEGKNRGTITLHVDHITDILVTYQSHSGRYA
jgi:hypothetical protein